jgi:hypothetical protein
MTKKFLVPISTDHVDFNLNNEFADIAGRLRWNSGEGTLDLGMNNEVVQSIGMAFYMPPTKNSSGESIANGSFVMATGSIGDRITIAKAVTDGSANPMFMIGFATHTIDNESDNGIIITNGIVKGINTSLWEVGTVLYPNPSVAGGLTSVKPDAPNIRTAIAFVLRQHVNTGRIYVRMTNGSILGGTDSNVKFENLQNNQIISYNANQEIWENKDPSASPSESGSVLPESIDNGLFFYNTTSEKLYFFFDKWNEISTSTISTLDSGNSETELFDIAINGGNSSDTEFAVSYDGGDSSTQF